MAEKQVKSQTLRTLQDGELHAQLHALRRELWEGQMKARNGSMQQPHGLSKGKRQIARILTVLRERRNG